MKIKKIFKVKKLFYFILGAVFLTSLLTLGILYIPIELQRPSSEEAYVYIDGYEVRVDSEAGVSKFHAKNKGEIKSGEILLSLDDSREQADFITANTLYNLSKDRLDKLESSSPQIQHTVNDYLNLNICKGLHFKESFQNTLSLINTLQKITDKKLKIALTAKYNFKNSKAALELGRRSHEEVLILEYKYKTARAILDSYRNCLNAIKAKEKSLKSSKKSHSEKHEKELKLAKLQVEHAESMLQKTKTDLKKTMVKSPADGIVLLKDTVEIGKPLLRDEPVAFILKPQSSYILAKFKKESAEIKSGDAVEISFENSTHPNVPGQVEQIVTPSTKLKLGKNSLLTVRINFKETDSLRESIYPGLKARVKVSRK
jgi:multidrug resistance efflux pump